MTQRLVIECVGSRGDVEPYLGLGQGLREAGYDVIVATHDTFSDHVDRAGLSHRTIAGNPDEIVRTAMGIRWQDSGTNPILMAKRLRDLARPILDRYLADTQQAVADADAVIFSALGVAAYHVAELHGIPAIGAFLAPMTRTREFGNPMVRFLPNALSHTAFEQTMWQFIRRDMNQWRADMGLAPFPWNGPYRRIVEEEMPILYGFSPTLVPRPADWPDFLEVTGAWTRTTDEPLDDRLVQFLTDGPAPVYIGFGSRSDQNAGDRSEAVRGALRITGHRGVIAAGWGGLESADSDSVISVGETNHQLLFQRCAAVVHHGGAGTTHTAATSGTPSIVIPHWADQFFWADRIAAVGAGPRPITRNRLTGDELAIAIDRAIGQHAVPAAAIGHRLRQERGVEAAVDAVQEILG